MDPDAVRSYQSYWGKIVLSPRILETTLRRLRQGYKIGLHFIRQNYFWRKKKKTTQNPGQEDSIALKGKAMTMDSGQYGRKRSGKLSIAMLESGGGARMSTSVWQHSLPLGPEKASFKISSAEVINTLLSSTIFTLET